MRHQAPLSSETLNLPLRRYRAIIESAAWPHPLPSQTAPCSKELRIWVCFKDVRRCAQKTAHRPSRRSGLESDKHVPSCGHTGNKDIVLREWVATASCCAVARQSDSVLHIQQLRLFWLCELHWACLPTSLYPGAGVSRRLWACYPRRIR